MMKKIFYIFLLLIVGTQCKKEFTPETNTSDIRYNPLGEGKYIDKVLNADENSLYLMVNRNSIIKTEGQLLKVLWNMGFSNYVNTMIKTDNSNELFVFENGNYSGYNYLYITKLGNNGNIVFKTSGSQKLITKYPNLHEQYNAACSDGNNGLYILVYLTDGGSVQKRVLIHMNASGTIDQSIDCNGFYVYMTSDNNGNLFIIRTYSSGGAQMKLEVSKVDMAYLKSNNALKKVWNYYFTSNEVDWNWTNYFPFKFNFYNEHLYIIKQHCTGINDQSTGLDCIILNAADKKLISTFTIPTDISINNYNNQITFYPLYSSTGNYICFNYGEKAKAVETDDGGNTLWQQYLSGNENRCHINGIGSIGSRKIVFGHSTLNKSPSYIPFYYFLN